MRRRAIIKVACEMLPEVAGILRDHNLRVIATLTTPVTETEVAMLVIEDEFGDKLPPECDRGWWAVRVQMTQETCGKQQLVRISKMDADMKYDCGPAMWHLNNEEFVP